MAVPIIGNFNIFIQSLLPPKLAPNQARLVIISESSLKFGKELGAGAFGTVYEVRKSNSYWYDGLHSS